jgi:hypothetical protein
MTLSNKTLVVFASLVMLSGCSSRMADLTLVSTKNLGSTNLSLSSKSGKRERAEDCKFSLLGIPFGIPSLETAVDKALQAGNGTVMIDEVTEEKTTWVVLGNINCIVVEGTVVNVPK